MLSDNPQLPLVLRMHARDAELLYSFWAHPAPVAALVHFHGIESHSGWYTDFAVQLWSKASAMWLTEVPFQFLGANGPCFQMTICRPSAAPTLNSSRMELPRFGSTALSLPMELKDPSTR